MTKKLTWEESWGKVDWNTATREDIKNLIREGADVGVFVNAEGKEISPRTFVDQIVAKMDEKDIYRGSYHGFGDEYLTENFIRLDDIRVELRKAERKAGVSERVEFLHKKYEYNEKKELEKTNWKDLTWEFVSGKVIKEMVKKGLDVNENINIYTEWREGGGYHQIKSSSRRYPLQFACAKDNIEAVKALIELGADPNKAGNNFQRGSSWSDDGESTPVPVIDSVQSLEIANYLIEHGMKVTPKQMLQVKKRDKKRSGLLKLLDSLNEQEPTEIRKAAKEAAVKVYRSKNPKTSGR